MKIAVVSENGTTVCQHFGRAPLYVVATVENGKITGKENRDKVGHHTFAGAVHRETVPGERHGYDAPAHSRHAQMAQNINDCQVVITGGMGWGAYDGLKSLGIEAIITDINSIDEALNRYLQGDLPNLMEKLH
jgi:predicted Fe-Mo cluster-binding NifX family protein